ncbi:AfsR/SARP family transcriptional regulator [Streptomyces griseoincarnatus]|uniref:OmpR/PhoB-type domain-containing protein n=1 Tax=Streptomyces tunisiensis TaxID=948699 RepID=A0ABP7YJN9_9ACTN|nr:MULTISPECIES: AfsR/SARP family transcriptional regulator [unclassified Streptomyces]MBQ0975311.1 AfsR/SARP family transcriptional regulator [Streptomyces sp. RK31]WPW17189.1 AfsR/SARP family transcriptional regulator [Streptomyces griseoincarnatus]WPW23194.1 AfsR/SARP family transcriptional regulator [Streptomyces griseoincarnatus]
MDIGILGSLAVGERGVSITPTAPKPRQVLALLALHADQVVTVGTLTEELWGAAPPRSARPTLQTYILQLREHIACALRQGEGGGAGQRCAKDVLLTVPGGYLLKGGQGASDLRDFERLAGLGYRAMDAGDYAGAAARLSEALELWSGPALADVHAGVHLATEIRRLEESRLCALDQRIEADLRLGRHRELLAELTVLVSRYPTHESLCGQYMLALHRSGRRGEALNAYRQLRARLVRSLGLEPSAALAKLQRSILVSGPAGAPAPAGMSAAGASAPAGTSAAGRLAPAG